MENNCLGRMLDTRVKKAWNFGLAAHFREKVTAAGMTDRCDESGGVVAIGADTVK